jgi:DNA-binding transcriptional LysR family regulator
MDVITHVRTFVAVVKFGTFADAARGLDVVPSVVARRIAQLEQELNTRLFERNTRSVALTEAGEKFYARAADLVGEFDELLTSVERDAGKLEGHLRVMAPTTLATQELAPVFCAFLARHPRITMQLALVDRSANPAESGFDIAISGRLASYEGVVDVPLQPVDSVLCASPEYVEATRRPLHPRDLVTHSCLVFAPIGVTWHFQSSRGVVSVDVPPRLQADDNMTLLQAAKSGLGIALLPRYISAPALNAGALVRVLPEYSPQESWFKAYVPRRRMNLARVKAFLDWMTLEWVPTEA